MEIRMDGRNAIITGGSLGIGRAIAMAFARSGANVAIVARGMEALEKTKADIIAQYDTKVIAISADVSQADGCQRAYDEARSTLGEIDILINGAGSSNRQPFEDISDAVWQADLDLKLFAAIRLSRLAMPGMKERKWGRIINILNTGAKAPPGGGAPTAVSRAAGMALGKVLAGEGAAHNVLVNSLLVGKIESDQWERRHEAEGTGESLAEFYAKAGKVLPMGRMGKAEEFANMAAFLVSDAGSYITGTAINVDGGLSPVV